VIKPKLRTPEVYEIAKYYDKSYSLINYFQLADDNMLERNARKLGQQEILRKMNVLGREQKIKQMVLTKDGRVRFQ